ncbi:unnamed protein product, partial [Brassica rapa]
SYHYEGTIGDVCKCGATGFFHVLMCLCSAGNNTLGLILLNCERKEGSEQLQLPSEDGIGQLCSNYQLFMVQISLECLQKGQRRRHSMILLHLSVEMLDKLGKELPCRRGQCPQSNAKP